MTGGVDASADGDSEGGVDALCGAHCACLAETCATTAGYPFAAAGSCASFCAGLGAAERACFPKWCTDAKAAAGSKVHLCEHAWGAFGLDECP